MRFFGPPGAPRPPRPSIGRRTDLQPRPDPMSVPALSSVHPIDIHVQSVHPTVLCLLAVKPEVAIRVRYPWGLLRPVASPVSGGCAAHNLVCQFPTATSCRVELKVGMQGVGQWGVARDWQALQLLDKPTRAVPTSFFLSVFDPQPKSAAVRSRNSNRNYWRSLGTQGGPGVPGVCRGP